MPTIGETRDRPQIIQAVIHGYAGTGKTFGAGSFPRPHFLDFDVTGHRTLSNPEFVARYGLARSNAIRYESFPEKNRNAAGVPMQHNAFDDATRYVDEWMKPGKIEQFDTWVIDSGTSLSEVSRNKAIILLGTTEFHKLSKTHEQAVKHGMIFPKKQDYGAERSMLEQFIRKVRDTGKHVLFLCHSKDETNDAGNKIATVPILTGQSPEVVSAMFDNVWFLKVTKQGDSFKRTLITHTDGIIKAKSRDSLPDGTEFDYDAIIKAITFAPASAGTLPATVAPATKQPA